MTSTQTFKFYCKDFAGETIEVSFTIGDNIDKLIGKFYSFLQCLTYEKETIQEAMKKCADDSDKDAAYLRFLQCMVNDIRREKEKLE